MDNKPTLILSINAGFNASCWIDDLGTIYLVTGHGCKKGLLMTVPGKFSFSMDQDPISYVTYKFEPEEEVMSEKGKPDLSVEATISEYDKQEYKIEHLGGDCYQIVSSTGRWVDDGLTRHEAVVMAEELNWRYNKWRKQT